MPKLTIHDKDGNVIEKVRIENSDMITKIRAALLAKGIKLADGQTLTLSKKAEEVIVDELEKAVEAIKEILETSVFGEDGKITLDERLATNLYHLLFVSSLMRIIQGEDHTSEEPEVEIQPVFITQRMVKYYKAEDLKGLSSLNGLFDRKEDK